MLAAIGGVGGYWEGASRLLTAGGLMDYIKKMQKNVMKFGAGVLGLVIVGGAVWYGVLLYQERNSPEYALMREYEKLSEAYKNDTYGGDTPEETLRLFIDALKAGDTDLAAKYFVVEEREQIATYFGELKNKDGLSMAIADADKLRLSKKEEDRAFFTTVNEKNVVEVMIILGKISNGKWKILEL